MIRPIVVALHGVGATAAGLAEALRPLELVAEVVALPAPDPFEGGDPGRQWFSVAGVTEANRSDRIAAALPPLLARLDALSASHGVARDELVLLGFSQGAILAMAAVAGGFHHGPAIAIAGRLAVPVAPAGARPARLLLLYDRDDRVMPVALSAAADAAFAGAGHRVDRVVTSGLGHGIGSATLGAITEWLSTLPKNAAAAATVQG
jgi:phospholipase/carboxylesterase